MMPISAWIMFAVTALVLFGGIIVCLVKTKVKR
jgi:hypothetical protein